MLPPCNQPPKQPAPLMSTPARSDTRLHASNQFVASSGAIPVLERMITELTVQQPDDALGFMIDFLTTTRDEPAASASRHERGAGSALEAVRRHKQQQQANAAVEAQLARPASAGTPTSADIAAKPGQERPASAQVQQRRASAPVRKQPATMQKPGTPGPVQERPPMGPLLDHQLAPFEDR